MTATRILVREGRLGHNPWRQYFVITNSRVAVVHMVPALWGGWHFDRVDVQDGDSWPNMTADLIVEWKMHNDDGLTKSVDDLDDEFRHKLLARAGVA